MACDKIFPKQNTASSKIFQDNKRQISVLDWTKANPEIPYIMENDIFLPLEIQTSKFDEKEIERIKNNNKNRAFAILSKQFNKKLEQADKNNIFDKLVAQEVYIPERPINLIKVHYKIDSALILSLPQLEQKSPQQNKIAFEIALQSSLIFNQINKLNQIIQQTANSASYIAISNIIAIDLKDIVVIFNNFISSLSTFLIANGLRLRNEINDLILLGFDQNNKITSILIDQGEGLTQLFQGIELFSAKQFQQDFIIRIFQKFDEISSFSLDDDPIEFIQKILEIEDKILDFDSVLDINSLIGKAKEQINSVENLIENANLAVAKTTEEIENEAELISADIKLKLYDINKNVSDFVGDNTIANLEESCQSIEDLKELYALLLNRIGIEQLIQLAIEKIGIPDPIEIAKQILKNLPIAAFIKELQEKLNINIIEISFIVEAFLDEIILCAREMTEIQFQQFLDTLGINNLEQVFDLEPETILNLLGSSGNRLLSSVIERFQTQIVDQLSAIDLEKFIPEIQIPEFSIPTFDFPDNIPTSDIMGFISSQIETAILSSVSNALISIIKSTICGIIKSAQDSIDFNFGTINLDDLILNGLDSPLENAKRNVAQELIRESSQALNAEELIETINNAFEFLSPTEIGNLLNGTSNAESLDLVEKYFDLNQEVSKNFPTRFHISKLFKNLGGLLEPAKINKLLTISNAANAPKLNELCATPINDIRRQLLEEKGLSKKQIDEQIDNIAKRKKEAQIELQNLMQKAKNGNLLKDIVPDVFCGKSKEGIVPKMPESFQFMMDQTLNVLFDGVQTSFDSEISSFPSTISDLGKVASQPRKISRKISIKDPNSGEEAEITNPEFLRLIANGVSVEDPYDVDGDDVSISEPSPLEENAEQKYVAKGLRGLLQSFESNKNLIDFSGNSIKITVPISLESNKLELDTSLGSKFLPEAILEKLNNSEISDNIVSNYSLLIEFGKDLNFDQYSVSIIKSKKKTNNNILAINRKDNIPNNIKNFFDTLSQPSIPSVSSYHSWFAKIMSASLKNGIPNFPINELKMLENIMEEQAFNQMFIDILSRIMSDISYSPLFKKQIIYKLNLLNIPESLSGKCKKSLLRISDIKNKIKNNVIENECAESVAVNPSGREANLGLLENSTLESATELMIKIYAIEHCLKCIFIFNQNKAETKNFIDNIMSDIFADSSIQNLRNKFSNSIFLNDFEKSVISLEVAKNNQGSKSFENAFSELLKMAISETMEDFAKIIGSLNLKENDNLLSILINKQLPVFECVKDVAKKQIRFDKNLQNAKTLTSFFNNQASSNIRPFFSIQNGNFILERYLRVDSNNSDIPSHLKDVANIEEFNNWFSGTPPFRRGRFLNSISKISYGLRLSYVAPISNEIFNMQNENLQFINKEFQQIFNSKNIENLNEISAREKAYNIFEKLAFDESPINNVVRERSAYIIPIASSEIQENNLNASINFEQQWNNNAEILSKDLQNSNEIRALFDYIFSVKRMFAISSIVCNLYLQDLKDLKNLFNGTKTAIKTVFMTSLNSGKYDYEDDYIKNTLGGNAGTMGLAQEGVGTDPEIDGLSLAAIAARTPVLILKGVVEASDPAIGAARRDVNQAKENGKNLGILPAVLKQLPINIFPPIPFGPGIGPPITPLGFAYLGLGVDDAFESAKNKQTSRKSISDESIDLTKQSKNLDEDC